MSTNCVFKTLLQEIQQYKFCIDRINLLVKNDLQQLEIGGHFINLSRIHIRDWSNHSDHNWRVDMKRLSFYSKREYLGDIDEFTTLLYGGYLNKIYESLFNYLVKIYNITEANGRITIEDVMKKLDKGLHNKLTPFGFLPITFLFCFNKIRNKLTHDKGVLDPNVEFRTERKDYLKEFFIDQCSCEAFSKRYFNPKLIGDNQLQFFISYDILSDMITFTQSYAFEIYKNLRSNDQIDKSFFEKQEILDIKTELPLTTEQKEYLKTIGATS